MKETELEETSLEDTSEKDETLAGFVKITTFIDSYAIDYLSKHNFQNAVYYFRISDPVSQCKWISIPTFKPQGTIQEVPVPEPIAALLDAFRAGKKITLWVEPNGKVYPKSPYPDAGKVASFRRMVVSY